MAWPLHYFATGATTLKYYFNSLYHHLIPSLVSRTMSGSFRFICYFPFDNRFVIPPRSLYFLSTVLPTTFFSFRATYSIHEFRLLTSSSLLRILFRLQNPRRSPSIPSYFEPRLPVRFSISLLPKDSTGFTVTFAVE